MWWWWQGGLRKHICMHANAHVRTHMHTHTHTRTHAHMHTRTHTRTHTRAHSHMHTYPHSHARTHTHTHTHTRFKPFPRMLVNYPFVPHPFKCAGLARTVHTHRIWPMYGDFPAKITVYTPYIPINVWFWSTIQMRHYECDRAALET